MEIGKILDLKYEKRAKSGELILGSLPSGVKKVNFCVLIAMLSMVRFTVQPPLCLFENAVLGRGIYLQSNYRCIIIIIIDDDDDSHSIKNSLVEQNRVIRYCMKDTEIALTRFLSKNIEIHLWTDNTVDVWKTFVTKIFALQNT